MKVGTRIALTLALISAVTIIILTVLMHLRFNVTSQILVKERINLTTSSFVKSLEEGIRLGIMVESIQTIPFTIAKLKNQEPIIQEIYVIGVEGDQFKDLYHTSETFLSHTTQNSLLASMKGAKGFLWMSKSADGNEYYIGRTIKDPSGTIRAVIIVKYEGQQITNLENEEIKNLYYRMMAALLVSTLCSFFIGLKNTSSFEKSIDAVIQSLNQINTENKKIDLSQISDPYLRYNVREMINTLRKSKNKLNRIEHFLKDIKDKKDA